MDVDIKDIQEQVDEYSINADNECLYKSRYEYFFLIKKKADIITKVLS